MNYIQQFLEVGDVPITGIQLWLLDHLKLEKQNKTKQKQKKKTKGMTL